jgi:hypothetical protein
MVFIGSRQLLALVAGLFPLAFVTGARPWAASITYVSNPVRTTHDVFVIAHEDDWQLFMGDVVAKRIRAGDSATFIYLTAGDGGRDSLYWQTRERAALQSTRVAIGPDATDSTAIRCSRAEVLDHAIQQCVIANTRSYFLRLPDGKRNGAGFAQHDFQSLRRLRRREILVIGAVDGSAVYKRWEGLTAVVGNLIGSSSSDRDVVVHASDPSIIANPHDHYDHRMAGLLVEDLRRRQGWNTRYYTGYALATRAANRSTDEAREKTAIFIAYDKEMIHVNKSWSAYEEHPGFYSQCMLRTYGRKARSSGGR